MSCCAVIPRPRVTCGRCDGLANPVMGVVAGGGAGHKTSQADANQFDGIHGQHRGIVADVVALDCHSQNAGSRPTRSETQMAIVWPWGSPM